MFPKYTLICRIYRKNGQQLCVKVQLLLNKCFKPKLFEPWVEHAAQFHQGFSEAGAHASVFGDDDGGADHPHHGAHQRRPHPTLRKRRKNGILHHHLPHTSRLYGQWIKIKLMF